MTLFGIINLSLSPSELTGVLEGEYSKPMVVLSILLSIMASYVTLEISRKISVSDDMANKSAWLWSGAVVLGAGVWAMHFIGMMAFILPVPVAYDVPITLVSIVPVVLACYLALWIISRKTVNAMHIAFGGVFFGAGIGSMHYIGMFAMKSSAIMYFRVDMLLASVVGAVVLAALSISTRFVLANKFGQENPVLSSLIGSVVMGAAIATMHYVAMRASVFCEGGEFNGFIGGAYVELLSAGTSFISILLGLAVVLASELSPKRAGLK